MQTKRTLPEQVDAILLDPRLDIDSPSAVLLKVQIERRHQNQMNVDDANSTLIDAARSGETAGVIRSLQERVQFHERLLRESENRVLKTAEEQLKSKTPVLNRLRAELNIQPPMDESDEPMPFSIL